MNEAQSILVETTRRIFSQHCTRELGAQTDAGIRPDAFWTLLGEAGLFDITAPEEQGGAGAEMSDLCAILRAAGASAAPAPLAEVSLAGEMIRKAGLDVPVKLRTIGPVVQSDVIRLKRRDGRWYITGSLRRVPWARHLDGLVIVAESEDGPRTVVVDDFPILHKDWNHAREPRDTIVLEDQVLPDSRVSVANTGLALRDLMFLGALFRTVAMAGALERTLELTVDYAQSRVQFGRPIATFQAIQQQVAVMATEITAASAAAESAVLALSKGGHFEIAAAKARVGEAAGIAAGVAHQVHAAMGFTYEYDLQRFTRRLWSWREEFGSDVAWSIWVGRAVASVGGDRLWALITSPNQFNLPR